MTRRKRSLEGGDEDKQPERKRPALASVIMGAIKVASRWKFFSSMKFMVPRSVSEKVECALAKIAAARLNVRSSLKQIEGPDGRNLQLRFRYRLSLPLFTGGKIEGEQGAAIHIVLLDANTGHVVTSGSEASVKLDVVVLEGDFNNEDDEDWTQEEFESHVVKEREGKRPLLTGDLQVKLKEGEGTLGELVFTDNSCWMRSRKFRLGLKVASGYCEGIRICEAKTEAFTVKDRRGESYKKHYPPATDDDVWRLEKIRKDGPFHKRLNDNGIVTVKDFLCFATKDPQKLWNILGGNMSNKMQVALLKHAKTCVPSGKLFVYSPEDSRNIGVVFDNMRMLTGLIYGEQYCLADFLSDEQKILVDTLVKKAHDNWNQIIECDGKSLLSFKQSKRSNTSKNELQAGQLGYSNSIDHQTSLPQLPPSISTEETFANSGLPVKGYNDNVGSKYSGPSQLVNPNSCTQFASTSFTPHAHMSGSSHQSQNMRNDSSDVGLAFDPPQASISRSETLGLCIQPCNCSHFHDRLISWDEELDELDEFLAEEEVLES